MYKVLQKYAKIILGSDSIVYIKLDCPYLGIAPTILDQFVCKS